MLIAILLVAAYVVWQWTMRRARVSFADARRLVSEGASLVDVRTPEEFAGGSIAGAKNIPLQTLLERPDAVGDRTHPVVLYCHSGMRSRHAAATLRAAGFTAVHDLGPRSAWRA